jgi:hypothetical protein
MQRRPMRGPFDVLVSDVGLPDGDDYELMRRMRAIRSVPGFAMSRLRHE